jgi:lipopolysaccharide heptosyltransferase II
MLQIANPRERLAVAAADAGLRLAALFRARRRQPAADDIRRILVLRIERIGDLMMSLPALYALRTGAPRAEIDLVVGSWNRPLAALIPGINRIDTMDVPWLARGATSGRWPTLIRQARSWRARDYDLAISLEGDIRSIVLMSLAGSAWQAGFGMAGGGPLLDRVVPFDPTSHTAVNGWRLVRAALGDAVPRSYPRGEGRQAATALPRAVIDVPPASQAQADGWLDSALGRESREGRRLAGIHVGAGREVKEWPAVRFAAVGARLAVDDGVTLVLTGAEEDRAAADALRAALPPSVPCVDLVGRADILALAAVFKRLSLLITPDTGPMHLAAGLGIPLVAVFGPSSPERWGPLSARCRIVRTELPCSPCNRIRTPPARCVGHTPDCMEAVGADAVLRAARELLADSRPLVPMFSNTVS